MKLLVSILIAGSLLVANSALANCASQNGGGAPIGLQKNANAGQHTKGAGSKTRNGT